MGVAPKKGGIADGFGGIVGEALEGAVFGLDVCSKFGEHSELCGVEEDGFGRVAGVLE